MIGDLGQPLEGIDPEPWPVHHSAKNDRRRPHGPTQTRAASLLRDEYSPPLRRAGPVRESDGRARGTARRRRPTRVLLRRATRPLPVARTPPVLVAQRGRADATK